MYKNFMSTYRGTTPNCISCVVQLNVTINYIVNF